MDQNVLNMLNARFDRLEDNINALTQEVADMKNEYTADKAKVETTTRIVVWVGGAVVTAINIALNILLR